MTALYMFRLYAMTFRGHFRANAMAAEYHLHESPAAMTIPLVLLAILSAVGGFLGVPAVFKENAHWLEHFLSPVFEKSTALQVTHDMSHQTELMLMGVVTALVTASLYGPGPNSASTKQMKRAPVLANCWRTNGMWMNCMKRW